MRYKFLLLSVLAATPPAWADDRPLIRPTRDVAVEYRSGGGAQGQTGSVVMMRFASKTNRIRIDGAGGQGYAILDPDASRMTVVVPDKRTYFERPADPGMVAMFQGTNSAYRKTGTATVAGVACTTYDATINDRSGQVCLTNDGVLLRARTIDADRDRQLEAVKVTYSEQPAPLFETPAGYQKTDGPDQTRRPISGFGPPDVRGGYMGTPTGR